MIVAEEKKERLGGMGWDAYELERRNCCDFLEAFMNLCVEYSDIISKS